MLLDSGKNLDCEAEDSFWGNGVRKYDIYDILLWLRRISWRENQSQNVFMKFHELWEGLRNSLFDFYLYLLLFLILRLRKKVR
jgi:hypothetical protein